MPRQRPDRPGARRLTNQTAFACQPPSLIVEDRPAIAELVSLHCRHAGYTVKEARMRCPDARDIVDETLPDLVVLDWMLPDKSGIDFARELRRDERTHDLPIPMLTARCRRDDKVRGLGGVPTTTSDQTVFAQRSWWHESKTLLRRARTGRERGAAGSGGPAAGNRPRTGSPATAPNSS